MKDNARLQKNEMMLTESIKTLIPKMAVPTIIAQLISTIYNLVDTYFVSSLGTNAIAAVGVNNSLLRLITLIGSLLGAGACSYISRLLGAKKSEEANRVLSTSLFSGLALGIVVMVLGLVLAEPMVYMLGATDDCALYAEQYATYILYGAPFLIGTFILNMCLRSEGSATLSMIGTGFGSILNCLLDPLFIYALDLGVAGAAMATAISQTVSFFILLYPYVRKTSAVVLSIRKFKLVAEDVKEVLSIGATSFFRSGMGVLSGIVINHVAGAFSTSVLAALSVSSRIMDFPFAIILGFGQGYQPVVGYNWGAKAMKRVKESLSFSSWVSVIGAIVGAVLLIIFAEPLIHIFNSEADTEVLAIGILCIRLQSITMPFHAFGSIINMFYAGIGKAKHALLMSTARQGYCFIPVALIAPLFMGVYGAASAQAIADAVSMAIAVPLAVKAFHMLRAEESIEAQ